MQCLVSVCILYVNECMNVYAMFLLVVDVKRQCMSEYVCSFFSVCILYVNVCMNMYEIFLLRVSYTSMYVRICMQCFFTVCLYM